MTHTRNGAILPEATMTSIESAGMQDLAGLPAGQVNRHRLVRWLFAGLGFLLTGIGILGMILPLLPTTVFLLGAAGCFAKASPGAYKWLTTNRLFGSYLRNYREHKGATLGTKIFSISTLWVGLGFSGFVIGPVWWVDLVLGAVAVGVTWHLVSLKTLPRS